MSIYKQSIQAFANVINSKIIPTEDLKDLYQIVIKMPEDDEEIISKIDDWLKPEPRSKIKENYEKQLNNLSGRDPVKAGFGGAKAKPGKESESSKILLINTIKENTPEPKPEENSEDKSEDK